MSVKCGYSDKYYPLLRGIFTNDVSETKEEFKKFIEDTFLDPNLVYRMFMSGVDLNSTQTPVHELKQVSSRTGIEVKTDSNSAQQYYIGEAREYNKMANDFAKTIISLSVFDLSTETFVDPNQMVGDVSLLNKGIFDYKKSLLNTVAQYIGESTKDIDVLNTSELNDFANKILAKFESIINHTTDHDANYYRAYNAFVTLKTFEDLLRELTPFVTINPEYKKASLFSKQKYKYIGPNVQHYTGFSTNEFADIKDAVSDLAKILLKYIPEVNSNGNIIDGTSISLSGFNSVMGKLKMWAEDSNNSEVQEELKKGTLMDMRKLISLYEEALSTNKNINPEHVTYLRSKLAGIKRFIYSPKMSQDIKNMFTHLMEKTVLSSYVSYTQIGNESPVEVKNLTERTVLMQGRFIEEVIQAASKYWQNNKEQFKELLRKHNITVWGNKIKIGNALVTKAPTGVVSINGPVENFEQIIGDITQLVISDDFNQIAEQVHPNKDYTAIQLYTPVLANIIFNANSNASNQINYGQNRDLAKVLSVINGSDTINVIKNSEGNNLPLYQMTCLAYSHRNIYNEITKQIENSVDAQSPYFDNVVYENIQHVKSPKIRSEVVINGSVQTSAKLNESDVMHLAIVYDFYQNLVTKQSQSDTGNSQIGIIGLQSHVYSDKNKHFIMQFDINKTWNFGRFGSFNFKTLLDKYFKTANKNDLSRILDVWFNTNKAQMETTTQIILDDYARATGRQFKDLSELKEYLSKTKIDEVKGLFAASGVEFIEEIHASKIGGQWTVNETLRNFANIFTDRNKFDQFVNDQFNQFLKESSKAWETIKRDKNVVDSFKVNLPQFVVNDQLLLKLSDGTVNPLLYSYFIIDSFLSNEYNKMMVGNVYAHPNKNKEKPTAENYLQHSLAARWISQVKRMVIYGATYHSYAQGLKYGVPERVKMAVMPDIGSNVQNIAGMSSVVDSMDGSGYTSPFLSRWQNVSLIDAAVGANKKTIYHDIDARYGLPKLLKWAEYEITNALRRNSSDVSLELMFKKMHDFKFKVNFNYSEEFDNLFFRDKNTGKYYKINKIDIQNGTATRYLSEVDVDGNNITDLNPEQFNIDSIYSIDQLFGGAWAMELHPLTNRLQYSEKNLDYINQIVCDYGLKDNMIGWVVNKSAIKVGASNLNNKSTWFDDSPLLYTTMSTKFGGVQMNADHELDEAEVTEMTQMISGLEQNGFTHEIATNAYKEIGRFCYEAISKLQDIIYKGDKNELYKIFGKAVVKAFQTGTKDTLGLAQAFVKLAQKSFNENNIDYRIPFSSSSINGIFNSTVTSSLVRDAIRRHYNGVAAVLNPSYNVMQYYNILGNNYRYEELIDLVKNATDGTDFEGLTVDEATKYVIVKDKNGIDKLNPFISDITPDNPIDFEDTIVIFNEPNGDGTYNRFGEKVIMPFEVKKIDSYETYDYYKHYEHRRMARWNIKPRNLKGSDTIFFAGGRKYSMFESPYTKVLHYFVEAELAANSIDDLQSEIRSQVEKDLKDITSNPAVIEEVTIDRLNTILPIVNRFIDTLHTTKILELVPHIKHYLIRAQQNLLNSLSELKPFEWGNEIITPESYKVIPAQIAMGKLYAKQLGLLPGDSIAQIREQGWEFFKDRISGYYTEDNFDVFTYDWTLFDGTGNKLYVKLRTPQTNELFSNSSPNSDYKVVEGDVYFNGEEICSADGKQFISYIDSDGIARNVVIIDTIDRLKELEKSKMFSLTQRNYRLDNYKELVLEQFGEGTSIQLSTRNKNNKWTIRNIAEFDTANQIVNALAENQDRELENNIIRLAKAKYDSFEKSLRFVGTRIPCQSMQSFAPMEIIVFTDSEVNEVYVPTNIFYLQGSDLDIDKQYILGYSISNNGYINIDADVAPYLRSDALRNRVVDNIFKVILDAKNQINLTMSITTDRMKELAKHSNKMGEAAKIMSPYNPASKYLMQIQNMVGKAVIGNVATALKSFFALSNVYNTRFRQIYDLIQNKQYDIARSLLARYTFNSPTGMFTLANVNVDMFKSLYIINELGQMQIDPNIPEDIAKTISEIIKYEDSLEDQSMLLGELLNSATDNAKELILKKINADTNWVDIYTVSFMLGADLADVGKLMLDDDITELIDNYSSSIFSDVNNTDKIKYINDAIIATDNPEKIKKYQQLLTKAIAADEVRILGKILKINQGLPTNTIDTYSYIKSIEKYIESRLNHITIDAVKDVQRKLEIAKRNRADEETIDALFKSLKIAKKRMTANWISFDLIKFILDDNYKQNAIEQYELNKINFNILEVIAQVPHFKEMFNVLALNKQILNSLSTRNRLEDIIWNQVQHRSKKGDGSRSAKTNITLKLDKEEIRDLKDKIDEHLITSWIISKNLSVTIPAGAKGNPAPETINLDSEWNINKFINYVETYAIPLLKEKLPNNKFISLLTFGLKNGIPFYKLPFNMVQVDNTQKTRSLYEEALYAFNNLNNIKVEGIDMNIVDMFYLYNLIINKDKFGPNSLTRIFEDLISTAGNEKLLVYDFNNWIDKQDIRKLVETFDYTPVSMIESTPVIGDTIEDDIEITDKDTDTSEIGFKEAPSDADVAEAKLEENADNQSNSLISQTDFTLHSGGAQGADSYWSQIGQKYNVKANHYYYNNKTPKGNYEISKTDYDEGVEHVLKANETLQRKPEKYMNLLARNWAQIKYSDAVFAISTIKNNIVSGGTGWAVQMAIDVGKPIFVFDQNIGNWYSYNYNTKVWDVVDTPVLTKNFAGIGTRELNTKGKWAIEDIYAKTFIKDYKSSRVQQFDLFANYYDTKPSVESRLIALVKAANMKGLHLVYDADLVNEDPSIRNAKGFIKNGEIYINADRATDDTVIHEFGHLYLADAKLQHPTEYYQLLSKVKETSFWKLMRSMPEYANKRGSDFDEEVLASLIDRSYNDGLGGVDHAIVVEALDLVSPEYKEFLKSDILPVLSDTFISNYKEQQKLATIKNKLIKDNVIKEDCK